MKRVVLAVVLVLTVTQFVHSAPAEATTKAARVKGIYISCILILILSYY